jgi:5-enolpyruvylshikimate-3-phosphate synthase
MALSVLATITDKALIINDAEAINKSYPSFFKDLASLKVRVEDYE